jgi:hypothetical protein
MENILFTLEIARKSLPAEAHPIHYARLQLVERMVRSCYTECWDRLAAEAEQIADEADKLLNSPLTPQQAAPDRGDRGLRHTL